MVDAVQESALPVNWEERRKKMEAMFEPKLPPINLHAMAQWSYVLEYRKHRELSNEN